MRFIDRLVKYLDSKRITAYSFERTCQVANGYLKKQQKGKGSIGSDILERIHRNYSELSLLWLISGQGEMIEPEKENGPLLNNNRQFYTKDEMIQFLHDRINLLESVVADKDKIIGMLELVSERRMVNSET